MPDATMMTANSSTDVNAPEPMRWMGWCGFLLQLPEFLRLARVDGDARSGQLEWTDQLQPRLVLRWHHDRRPPADPLDRLRKQAQRLIDKAAKAELTSCEMTSGSLEHLGPLVTLQRHHDRSTHILGLAEPSQRWFELIIPAPVHEGREFDPQRLLESLTDAAPDQPQRWSFFGNHFVTPAGFRLVDFTLNLGDMTLVLQHQHRRFVELQIRHLYPATIALKNQAPPRWIDDMHKQVYGTLRSFRHVPDEQPASFTCDRGPVWMRDLKLLRLLGPRRLRTWLLHHEAADRLVILQLTDHPEHDDDTWSVLRDGLDWPDGADR